MTVRVRIPAEQELVLDRLLLDLNGTLTDRGVLVDGVEERLRRLRSRLEVQLLSADTFGTLDELAHRLAVGATIVASGADKVRVVEELGARSCAAIGNGRNDGPMLRAAALGIAVVGPEGASSEAIAAADVVCPSILVALDLLLDPRALTATLRP